MHRLMLSLATAGVAFAVAAACTPGHTGRAQIDVADANDVIGLLRAQLFACCNPSRRGGSRQLPLAIVRIALNQDGSLCEPVLLSSPSQALAESALHAIRRCQPFKLPVAKYDMWQVVEIAFDARAQNVQ